ncbi:retrovirus-related Pol polyprotein from transposon opus [Trichonephila clavipes]|nr:retrovirus-related Pol polyprotein from transposon opus [Trichonephila clavipes]
MKEQMPYFSSVFDEWSRDLKSVQVQKQRACPVLKGFASEMVSDELKPKVLLCMLGDKVSNLLVNLGVEELKDYESLKTGCTQASMNHHPPKNMFRKILERPNVTLTKLSPGFATRLTSMWLYYCKLRGANDFESVNQLIVADKMFEMLDSETATHIGVLQGEECYKPRDWVNNVIYFTLPKGNPMMNLRELNGMIVKREVLMVVGINSHLGRKSDNFSSRKNFDQGQVTEIKKIRLFHLGGSDKHFKRDCPKNKEVDNKRLNVNKVSTEGTELVDGTVTARVDLLGKVIPRAGY